MLSQTLRFILIAIMVAAWQNIFSQAPNIEWQNTIGGMGSDYLEQSCLTPDGGYFLAGSSGSETSGDKIENSESNDWWVMKVNSIGEIKWQNTIGGDVDDYLYSAKVTPDGGFILAGESDSYISDDKTSDDFGNGDYWVVKLDSLGNIQWQKDFGGTAADWALAVDNAPGGYYVGGYSFSGVSGNKTEFNRGAEDYWVLKLDAEGNMKWQKTIGSSGQDLFRDLKTTPDGGCILAGTSYAGTSWDKTDAGWLVADYWVVKLDSNGNIQWQNALGGTSYDWLYTVELTDDGGYILGGGSASDADGDKTEENPGNLYDFWIVKLNSDGSIQWQSDIGGPDDDYCLSIDKTPDGGYVLGGTSYSGIGYDKTEAERGGGDCWVVKISDHGSVEWDKTVGGSDIDQLTTVKVIPDGGYFLGCYAFSGIGGDKTEASQGGIDYWILKLAAQWG